MIRKDPLDLPKEEYKKTIERIKSDSSVGIDAQYTHAVIIEYLKELNARVERIEQALNARH